MLDLSIQLLAACGPIALAIMGVVVSLNPPVGSKKAHKIWAGAFAVVGALAAGAIFFELRGTDQILGQIWEHIKEPKIAAKTGARLFFQIGGFTKESKKIDVNTLNSGDVMARVGSYTGSYYIPVDHALSEKEEEILYQGALKELPPMGAGLETPVGTGHITELELSNLTDAQYDGIINGTMHFYLVVVAYFRDELTPSGKANLASACAHFTKQTRSALACLSHIESRFQN